jgi:hypothetical protein
MSAAWGAMGDLDGQTTPEQHNHDALVNDNARWTIRTFPGLKRESSLEDFAVIKLLDALDLDERPSFAIRVQPAPQFDAVAPLDLIYCNSAFTDAEQLLAKISGQPDAVSVFVEDASAIAYRKWLWDIEDENNFSRRGKAYMFEGLIWTAITIQGYKIVSGIPASLLWPDVLPGKHHESFYKAPKNMPVQGRAPTIPPGPNSPETSSEHTPNSSPKTKHGPHDFTFPDAPGPLSDHVKRFRDVDWAHTPLGPLDTWPPELRNVVNMCLNDIHPCMLFWGDDVIMIYNEAYVQLIGVMHPTAMGKSARQVASDYWHTFQPLVDHINTTGKAVCDNEIPIFVDRHGFLEETYWSFQFIPVLDSHGHVAGYYHPLFETTKYISHH